MSGRGKVSKEVPSPKKLVFGEDVLCTYCGGTGERKKKICPVCQGQRVVRKEDQ